MHTIIGFLLFVYSSVYYYESPTYPGISSLYADESFYGQSLIGYSGYSYSLSFTGIVPFSSTLVKHANMDFFRKFGNKLYLYSGIRHRAMESIYTENTFLIGANYIYKEYFSFATGLRLINIKLSGSRGITKPSLDFSMAIRKSYFIISASFLNLLQPDLTITQSGIKSKIQERFLFSLNYPSNVFFSSGFVQDEGYNTPFFSTEVWFTHGFNVAFGVENHTVEGAISLRSKRFGVNFRVKSHTTMGATYIAGLSFYKE